MALLFLELDTATGDVAAKHESGPTPGNVALLNANQTFTGTNTFSNDIILEDAVDLALGTGSDALMRWSTGDADNHALVVGLGDSNQALHITDNGAVATDLEHRRYYDPNVYIHSNYHACNGLSASWGSRWHDGLCGRGGRHDPCSGDRGDHRGVADRIGPESGIGQRVPDRWHQRPERYHVGVWGDGVIAPKR